MSSPSVFASLGVGAAVFFAACPSFAEPIVQNPSFEATSLSTTGVFPGYVSANPTALLGWSVTAPTAAGISPVRLAGSGWTVQPFSNHRVAPDGINMAFLQVGTGSGNSTNTLSQVISGFNIGETYRVTYFEHHRYDSTFSQFASLTVLLGGVVVVPTHVVNVPNSQEDLRFMQSSLFTATSATNELDFIVSNPVGDMAVLLDMVSIVPVAVPEPSSLALLLIGGAGLLMRHRK